MSDAHKTVAASSPEWADALEWLDAQPEGETTFVVYDPPYAVGTPVRGREDGAAGSVFGPLSFMKPEFIDHAFGEAFVCTLFRKECPGLASRMIEDAIRRTELRWGSPPNGGWLTFVDPTEVASSNPVYFFKCAGFEPAGFTRDRGLLVLRREVTPHTEARSDSTEPGHRRELTVAAERQGQRRTGRIEGRVAA